MIMEIEFDKSNTNWNDKIMPKDIFTNTFDIAHLLLTQNHPILESIKPIIFGKYKVVMKFTNSHASGSIWINNQWKVSRRNKFGPVLFGKGVKLIEGTPLDGGGSNNYPIPSFKEGYCIIEFLSNGLPMTRENGWKTELLTLEQLS